MLSITIHCLSVCLLAILVASCTSSHQEFSRIILRSEPEHPLEPKYEIRIEKTSDGTFFWESTLDGDTIRFKLSQRYMEDLAEELEKSDFFQSKEYYENSAKLDGAIIVLSVATPRRTKTIRLLNVLPVHLERFVEQIKKPR